MKRAAYISLLLGYTIAVPTALVFPRQNDGNPLEHWPEMCANKQKQSKGENKVWAKGNVGDSLKIISSIEDGYDKYVHTGETPGHPSKSYPRFIAQSFDYDYNWQCDTSHCTIGSAAEVKCRESKLSAYNFLFLDSALAYWQYMDSLKKAIEDARSYIQGQLAKMPEDFGSKITGNEGFKESIGMTTAAAGMFAAFLPPHASAGVSTGVTVINGLSTFLVPAQSTEKKFERYSEASRVFGDNVDIITNSINKHINHEFGEKLDYNGNDRQAIHTAIDNDILFKAVNTGDFAGLDPPKIDLKDRSVRAALAAPLINAMWRSAENFVVKFDGPAWKAKGVDVCGKEAFPELRQQGEGKLGCDEWDRSLYMIAHWGRDPGKGYSKAFRAVKGIDRLESFFISRRDVITGSEKNQEVGGFNYAPKTGELVDRVKNEGSRNKAVNGVGSVWNLPFCLVKPSVSFRKSESLEEQLATAALSCGDMKDKYKKSWPWGKVGKQT